jgi:COP9 signalosome complex subunit 7
MLLYWRSFTQPFLALSKSATSPRAAADLITRATSAPNTFLFAELLQTDTVKALADSPDFASHLTLLQIFSHGTYQTYKTTPGLPDLSEQQATKLRQLSLLTLARQRANLSYDALRQQLGLDSARQLEDLVIAAVYAGLLSATLDPARQAVQVTSIAPLRDLAPGSVPDMLSSLRTWSDRCTTTLADLDEQIKDIRSAALARDKERRDADDKLQRALGELKDTDKRNNEQQPGGTREMPSRRGYGKRSVMDLGKVANTESMELDEPTAEEEKKRSSKRKL